MDTDIELDYIVENSEVTEKLSSALDDKNVQHRQNIFRLLSTLCHYSEGGYSRVLQTLEQYKEKRKERYRFAPVVDELRKSYGIARGAVLTLINSLVDCAPLPEERVRIRNEFIGLKLLDVLDAIRKDPVKDADIQVQLEQFQEEMCKDEERLTGPDGVDLNSHLEVFYAILFKVATTPVERPFLSLLHHLLQIDNSDPKSDRIWELAERLTCRATQIEKDEGPEKLLRAAYVQIDKAKDIIKCRCSCHRDEDGTPRRRSNIDRRPSASTPTGPSPLIQNSVVVPPTPPSVPPPPPPSTPGPPPLPPPCTPTPGAPPPPPPLGTPHSTPRRSKCDSEVVLPQQKTPKPKSKMRTFNWGRIPVNKVLGKNNLWTLVAQGKNEAPFDYNEMEELFSRADTSKKLGASGRGEGDKRKRPDSLEICLLDNKRSLNVNIYLKQYRRGYEELVTMIKEGNSKEIGAEKLKGLLKILPEQDEFEMLRSFDGDKQKLGTAERFFLQLIEIPKFKLRIECMLMREEFQIHLDYVKPSIDTVLMAAEDLKECKALQDVLFLILVAGNFMNSGGYAGNAAGFKLSSLLKLAETHANKPRMNLLHYVALQAEKQNPHLLHFPNQLKTVEDASRLSIEALTSEIKSIDKKMASLAQQLKLRENAELQKMMSGFMEDGGEEIVALREDIVEMERMRKELAEFFCEDHSTFKLEECFQTFDAFCKKFRKAVEENEQRKAQEEKQTARGKGHVIHSNSTPVITHQNSEQSFDKNHIRETEIDNSADEVQRRNRENYVSEGDNLLQYLERSTDVEDKNQNSYGFSRTNRPGSLPRMRKGSRFPTFDMQRERASSVDVVDTSASSQSNTDFPINNVTIKESESNSFSSPTGRPLSERMLANMNKFETIVKDSSPKQDPKGDIMDTPFRRAKSLRERVSVFDTKSADGLQPDSSAAEKPKKRFSLTKLLKVSNKSPDKSPDQDENTESVKAEDEVEEAIRRHQHRKAEWEQKKAELAAETSPRLDIKSYVKESVSVDVKPSDSYVRPTSLALNVGSPVNDQMDNGTLRQQPVMQRHRNIGFSGALMTIKEDRSPIRDESAELVQMSAVPEKPPSPPPDYDIEKPADELNDLSAKTDYNKNIEPSVIADYLQTNSSVIKNINNFQNNDFDAMSQSSLQKTKDKCTNIAEKNNNLNNSHKRGVLNSDLSPVKVGMPDPNSTETEWGVYIIPRSRYRRTFHSFHFNKSSTDDRDKEQNVEEETPSIQPEKHEHKYSWKSKWKPQLPDYFNEDSPPKSEMYKNKTNQLLLKNSPERDIPHYPFYRAYHSHDGKTEEQNVSHDVTHISYTKENPDDVENLVTTTVTTSKLNAYDSDKDEGFDTETLISDGTSQGTSNYSVGSELSESPKPPDSIQNAITEHTYSLKDPSVLANEILDSSLSYISPSLEDTDLPQKVTEGTAISPPTYVSSTKPAKSKSPMSSGKEVLSTKSSSATSRHYTQSQSSQITTPVKPSRKKKAAASDSEQNKVISTNRVSTPESDRPRSRSSNLTSKSRQTPAVDNKSQQRTNMKTTTKKSGTSRFVSGIESKSKAHDSTDKKNQEHGSSSSIASSGAVSAFVKSDTPVLRTNTRKKTVKSSSALQNRSAPGTAPESPVITPSRMANRQRSSTTPNPVTLSSRKSATPSTPQLESNSFVRHSLDGSTARGSFKGDSRSLRTTDAPKIAVIKKSTDQSANKLRKPTTPSTRNRANSLVTKVKSAVKVNEAKTEETEKSDISPLRRGAPERRTISGFTAKTRSNNNPATAAFYERLATRSPPKEPRRTSPQKTWC